MYIYKIEYTAFAKNNRQALYILLQRLSTINKKSKMQKRVFIYKESLYRHIHTYINLFMDYLWKDMQEKKNH